MAKKQPTTVHSPIAKRLLEARKRLGLSQKQLGIQAGFDEFSSSARMNQYERGKHVPDYSTSKRLAKALSVPVTYLYADDNDLAELILEYVTASKIKKSKARKALQK